ncbi:MAG TPA: HAD-IIIA family hydrolase [Burkholderiaceae bacterium]|jgi:3-deoxy-D-manno-octulosonate 8-phosphate phosphatase (KDO 8-P phosphatase)|nr:HAD-IIIA family hydrolase [Burkholderiaceae bacterium]
MSSDADAARRAAAVRLVALDVDGTLTDGRLFIGPAGEAMKAFSVRDGFGLTLLREAGIRLALITARRSAIVEVRAAELKFDEVRQGVEDKAAALRESCERFGLDPQQAAYVGDDWPDLSAMALAGLAASVADAPAAVRARAHWVSRAPAGSGAVREFAEFVLQSQQRLASALSRYTDAPS